MYPSPERDANQNNYSYTVLWKPGFHTLLWTNSCTCTRQGVQLPPQPRAAARQRVGLPAGL